MQQEHITFSVMMPMSMFVYRMLIEAPAGERREKDNGNTSTQQALLHHNRD